jgi:peptidyl-tRNA hydrolase, PTH1 family
LRWFGRDRAPEMSDDRWIVAGLGNPEPDYAGTRHNVGGEVVSALAARSGERLSVNKKAGCATAELRERGARVVLARPLGYMNNAGGPVQRAAAWYKVPPERLIVVHDDLDLGTGTLRFKRGGGPGGHNGLRDIDQRLGTREYLRVRIGIGRPAGGGDPRSHVLGRFSRREREVIDVSIEDAADATLLLVHDGLEAAQNRYH